MKKLGWLDRGIEKIIDTFEYDIYQVSVDRTKDCSCKNFYTKQGDATCKKCLGQGFKIKIKDIKGASQESSSSFKSQGMDEKGLATIFYISSSYHVEEQDIIVDGKEVYSVNRIERKKGTNREYVYQKCLCVNVKADVKIFMKNFKEIIEG